jgi:hypothetical protein
MAKLVLSDGGGFHRPGRPHAFSPGLRAAAHYLKAVETLDRGVREDLVEIFKTHDFPSPLLPWEIVPLSKEELAKTEASADTYRVRRFKLRWSFFEAFQEWLDKYYLWSPYVLDLLYRIMELWDELNREIKECESTIRDVHVYEKRKPLTDDDRRVLDAVEDRIRFLKEEQEGWGWWVDFLASDITNRQLEAWLQHKRAASDDHRQLLERMDRLRIDITWETPASAPPFRLILHGWQPEVEMWPAFEQRVRDACAKAIKRYRSAYYERFKADALNPRQKDSEHVTWGKPPTWETAPAKYDSDHFKWLALRQVKGLRPQEIADRHHAALPTVNEGIRRAAVLIELERRRGPFGRPSVYDDL